MSRLFYDGESVADMKEEYDTDLVDMFYQICRRKPNSWYKSYRVRDFIIDLINGGINNQDELRNYLIDNMDKRKKGLNFPDEILDDILKHFDF